MARSENFLKPFIHLYQFTPLLPERPPVEEFVHVHIRKLKQDEFFKCGPKKGRKFFFFRKAHLTSFDGGVGLASEGAWVHIRPGSLKGSKGWTFNSIKPVFHAPTKGIVSSMASGILYK